MFSRTLSTRASIIGRSTGGNAIQSAAYRSGTRLHDRQTDRVYDFSDRKGIEASFIDGPDDAPNWSQDREELWNRVEAAERRRDGQLAREVRLSFPVEFGRADRLAFARGLVQREWSSRGMISDVAIHLYGHGWRASTRRGRDVAREWRGAGIRFLEGLQAAREVATGTAQTFVLVSRDMTGKVRDYRLFQPHMHVMHPMRAISRNRMWFGAKGEVGKEWFNRKMMAGLRERIAAEQNQRLQEKGAEGRVDHRSYEERSAEALDMANRAMAAGKEKEAGLWLELAEAYAVRKQPHVGLAAYIKVPGERMQQRLNDWIEAMHDRRAGSHVEGRAGDPAEAAMEAMLALTQARAMTLEAEVTVEHGGRHEFER